MQYIICKHRLPYSGKTYYIAYRKAPWWEFWKRNEPLGETLSYDLVGCIEALEKYVDLNKIPYDVLGKTYLVHNF